MNNTTEAPTPEHVVTSIGIGYALTATITIPLHIVCSWLMWQDKEMRNPTYQFIINLSVADVLELVPLGWYAGIVILFRIKQNSMIMRIMAFWCMTAWYANCVLFAFIAFSRWIAMTRSHLVKLIFTWTLVFSKRNLRLMHLVPWMIIATFYFISIVLYPDITTSFYPDLFTWGFNMHIPFGEFLHWWNFGFNSGCAVVEMVFNIMSLKWVHKTRKTIQNLATSENQRRETKLLIQCFIIGCVFTLASVMFTIVFAAGLNTPMAFLGMQCVWTFNHCVNPLVYLSVNTKLRRALIKLVTCGKYGNTMGKAKNVNIPTASVFPTKASTAGPIKRNKVIPISTTGINEVSEERAGKNYEVTD